MKASLPKRLECKLAATRRREMVLAAQQRQQLWEEARRKGKHLFVVDGGAS
jgi:hypothetical protein